MTLKHYTTKERRDGILEKGMKTNSEKNMTLEGGEYCNYIYEINTGLKRPLYFCLDGRDSPFKKESDIEIEVDLESEKLVADLQSLVDYGAIFDEEGESIYFKRLPDVFKEYGFSDEIMVCELLEEGNVAAEAAIKLTGTGVYLGMVPTKKIKKIREFESFGLQGNCVESFDEDGNSLIDLFSDVTDFAQVEENSKEISRERFLSSVHIRDDEYDNLMGDFKNIIFLENKDRKILMAYDNDADVHYFFKESGVKNSYNFKKQQNRVPKRPSI